MNGIKGLFAKLGFVTQCAIVGTVLAQALAFGALYSRGDIAPDRTESLLRALDGVDVDVLRETLTTQSEVVNVEIPSHSEVMDKRLALRLDFDLRETSLEKGRQETEDLELRLKSAGDRYEVLKRQFDANFSRLSQGATDERLLELQENLESMKPAQAKEQIQRLLVGKSEDAFLNDVEAILKAMSADKRRKLIAEFQTPEETQLLAKLIDRIRRGLPDLLLFRETRDKLRVDHDAGGKPASQ
jgi:hypothetical protein